MTKRFFHAAAMSHTASAAHADAASSCAAAPAHTERICLDANALASIFILFALLAGLVCLRAILGVILAVLVITLLVQGVKDPSEAKGFA